MLVSLFGKRGRALSQDVAMRGYHVAYRGNEVNHCPGCGRSHWHIGRVSAECGFCGTALPLTEGMTVGAGLFRPRRRPIDDFATAA